MKIVRHYAKKKRQLRFLSKKISRLLDSGRFYKLAESKRKRLVAKFQKLSEKLKYVIPQRQLQKVVAGAAILLTTSVGTIHAQNFAAPVQEPFGLIEEPGINFPNLIDLDNDGDYDILGVNYDESSYTNAFRYIENVGDEVSPDFSEGSEINPFGLVTSGNTDQIWDFDVADMDNDGDLDIILGANTDNDNDLASFFYYENTGDAQNPSFAAPVIDPFGLGKTDFFAFPSIVDIDGDGDFDVIATEYYGVFKFYENTGDAENPSFAMPVDNPLGLETIFPLQELSFAHFTDLDGDGDVDLLSNGEGYDPMTEEYGNILYYQENIGTAMAPEFASATAENPLNFEIETGSFGFITSADLDDDGDIDVLLSRYGENKAEEQVTNWFYFENTTNIIDNVNELANTVDIDIFPNPTVEQVNLQATFEEPVDQLSLQLYNAEGKLLAEKPGQRFLGVLNESFDVQSYPTGLYFIKIQADEQYSTLSFAKK